jgi:hypothetical protein
MGIVLDAGCHDVPEPMRPIGITVADTHEHFIVFDDEQAVVHAGVIHGICFSRGRWRSDWFSRGWPMTFVLRKYRMR